jgi:L-ascorbate metabolism protein UlaG (beta-lactamase superfamily)
MPSFYLREDIKIVPTINSWYAWGLLFSPVTFAIITANHHLPILESYLSSPELHSLAIDDISMAGGPFIDTNGEDQSQQISILLQATKIKLCEQLKLAESIKVLNELIKTRLIGYSTHSIYKELPMELKGYVELFYDLNNTPNFRLFEPLLYKSDYYLPELQSVMLSIIKDDKRPFVLSTPIICEPESIVIKHPFTSECYDQLFQIRDKPTTRLEILDFSEKYLDVSFQRNFLDWFTEEKVIKQPSEQNGKNVRIRYFGHACLLIEFNSISILIDPLISYDFYSGVERFCFKDLPEKIDYVLITHAHQDHFVFETLLQLRHKVGTIVVPKNNRECIADPSLKLICKNFGFRHCIELDELESIEIPDGEIIGIPFLGEHGDLNIQAKIAYVIKINNKTIMCTADSNNLDNMMYHHIEKIVPKIDMMFIGMECDGAPYSWLYRALFLCEPSNDMLQSRRLDASEANKSFALINTFSCQEVYIYAMGQESWLKYISSIEYTEFSKPIIESNKLIQYCETCNIKAERLLNQKEIYLS